MTTFRERHRLLCFAWSYLECLGFSGLIFGWSSLVYVLKDEGLYLDLCPSDTNSSHLLVNGSGWMSRTTLPGDGDHVTPQACDARDAKLALVFTVASGVMGVGICVLGIINLKYGTRITRLILFVIFVMASLLVAFANNETQWLIFPGLAMIGIVGNTILITNVQVSFLFPVWGSIVVSMLSGALDASSFIQLLVKIGHENGISRFTSYIIITCAHSLTLINTFFLLPKGFIQKPGEEENNTGEARETNSQEMVKVNLREEIEDNSDSRICQCTSHEADSKGAQSKQSSTTSILKCLFSPESILLFAWFSLLNLRFLFYVTSINSVLEDTFDTDDEVSGYTNAMMYTLMFGAVISILPGYVLDFYVKYYRNSESLLRRRLRPCVVPLSTGSLLSMMLSMFLLFTEPVTIYMQFVVLVFLRSYLYSVVVANMRQLFPSQYLMTLYGIHYFASGVVGFFQYALFIWAERQGFQQVNIFLLVLSVVSLSYPCYLWRKSRHGNRKQEQKQDNS